MDVLIAGWTLQASKRGNSLAIRPPAGRPPAAVLEVVGLKEGDQVEAEVEVEVEVASARSLRIERVDSGDRNALARVCKLRGTLPVDLKFHRMEANVRDR